MTKLKKILIANRGEIACRIMKTAHRMGIQTVAVYSEADRGALHVRMADEAALIGPAESAESYLKGEVVIKTTLDLGADAIHPGYGFLSENAAFARRVEESGLIFIGPTADSMEVMGSKLAAKEAVTTIGVPTVPGSEDAVSSKEEASKIAQNTGYPILIKASAGGGGKGMRIVHEPSKLHDEMDRAVSEATASFGDGRVFIEKYIEGPRHIEVQVLFDHHGHGIYLGDRECSIQRRHQKVIEEAPANDLPDEVRKQMGEDAVKIGRTVDYRGAGTVEFLVDSDYNYYFLEMNTRLQVEHPVTELTTGCDLVGEQFRIAEGKELTMTQEEVTIKGHAIELRICAENPVEDFLPASGTLTTFRMASGRHIRLDTGYLEGQDVSVYYDPLIAKLVVWGHDRRDAVKRLTSAIHQSDIAGVPTTLTFGALAVDQEDFINGRYTTSFIPHLMKDLDISSKNTDYQLVAQVGKAILDHERMVLPRY